MNIVSGLGSSQPPVHRILQKLDRASSGRVAIVEVEEPPNPFASSNAALTSIRIRRTRFDQPIAESLVIPFHVVMTNVRSDRPPNVLFTERDVTGIRSEQECTRRSAYEFRFGERDGSRTISTLASLSIARNAFV